ncbi:cysteine proteinase inhibitor 1-like [Silene latifolia]|uniref:cysteine proteinase inhibitor 1-like n=1 Tax=Silene latifolia TaxID=37657 RepID=UPI003D76D48E
MKSTTAASMITGVVILSVLAESTTASMRGGALGGYTPITDLEDEHVQDVAKYAVIEHNIKANTNLEFLKIVRADYQVVTGNNYRLIISAKDGDDVRNYEALVNDIPWQMSRDLTSFHAI